MECATCGRANRPGVRFCEECGTPLVRTCPHCSENVPPDARFCGACGHLLIDATGRAAQPDAVATPAHLAEKMRRQRPAEGERRTVTVLFVDAVGSTPLAEQLGEERMYSLMRDCISRMAEAVHRYEGHVATFTGDGIMALFGAPIAHEDSARRAVAAALLMQRSLEDHPVGCWFRVGLNTGPVVVGTVTDDLRLDVTAVGDTVNLAARMEQAAEPGGVCISEHTYQVVDDFFDCEALGSITVKGKSESIRAWRVLQERPLRSRFEVAAERGLSPLVGRDRELAVLEGHAELARRGSGQVVSVSGEAGIGKSRLLLELRRRLTADSTRWLEGHCVAVSGTTAYLPFLDLLKDAFGIQESDAESDIIRRVEEALSEWEGPARRVAPYLRYLLGVDPGDPAVTAMDPLERRIGVFDALRALVVQESARRPLVVIMEDLHWADQMSQEALGRVIDIIPTTSVLLILTHRPGLSHSVAERVELTRLALTHLDDDESAALTRTVLQVDSLPLELERLITSKAEGNPFYVEEVSRALVEAGVVARANGTYRLQRRVAEVQIPDTIQAVILSRIDRLDQEARSAIQLASVIGREFSARILDRISALEAKLSEVLGELSALELIYEKAYFPELAYMFKHALTHDVAYATLLAERREALHRLVGAAIEELYQDRLAEHYEQLAYHYFEGQHWQKALHYLERAGDKGSAAYANHDALGLYARALSVCDTLGDEALAASASIAGKRAFVHFTIGDPAGMIADLDRMADVAHRLGDRSLEAVALSYRGIAELVSHDFDRAEATLDAARALTDQGLRDVGQLVGLAQAWLFAVTSRLAEAGPLLAGTADQASALPDPFTRGAWFWLFGIMEHWAGRPDDALGILDQMPDDADLLVFNRLFNWWVQTLALGSKGDYDGALRLLDQTLATCERVGDVMMRARVLNTIGWVHAELENHETAKQWNRDGVAAAGVITGWPDPEFEANARVNLGDNLMALGRLDDAEEQFAIVESIVRRPRPEERWMLWRYSQHLFHSYGELCLARGDPTRALAYADECLELALETSSAKNVVKGRRLRGQVLMAQGQLEEAEVELLAALEVAVQVGNPSQLWKTHGALGKVLRAQGRTDEARHAYGQAVSIIEAVAGSLSDERMRETFLRSKPVAEVLSAANGGL